MARALIFMEKHRFLQQNNFVLGLPKFRFGIAEISFWNFVGGTQNFVMGVFGTPQNFVLGLPKFRFGIAEISF